MTRPRRKVRRPWSQSAAGHFSDLLRAAGFAVAGTSYGRCLSILRKIRQDSGTPTPGGSPPGCAAALPAHLPQPPTGSSEQAPRGGRARSRWAPRRSAWLMVEHTLALFSHWWIGSPSRAEDVRSRMGPYRVSAGLETTSAKLFEDCRALTRIGVRLDARAARGAGKLRSLLDVFCVFSGHPALASEFLNGDVSMAADTSRLSLPQKAGTVNPLNILNPLHHDGFRKNK